MDDAARVAETQLKTVFKKFTNLDEGGSMGWLKAALVVVGLMILWQWVNSPLVVTVTGVGEIDAPVNNAVISLVLSANRANPTDAITVVNTKALVMKDTLIDYGISQDDLTNSQVSVSPVSGDGGLQYQAVMAIGAKLTDYSRASDLIAVLYNNGADYVSQPVMSVEDQKVAEAKATEMALADAKKQAGEIGWKQLKLIRKMVGVTHSPTGASSTVTASQVEARAVSADETPTLPATTNSIKVRKVVSVSYKMW
jgi:uncharacterized protein YggE